jgi:putative ABC transport system permease protein
MGIACTSLIAIFVYKEYNADNFHRNVDRIYALQADNPFNKGERMYFIRAGAAEYMKNNFSEVEDFCRILNASPLKVVAAGNEFFDDSKVIAASSNFFSFFSYRLLSNTPANVLVSPQDVVISRELALKYFGNANPVGQRLTLVNRNDQNEMIVSGVFEKSKEATLLNFDMVRIIDDIDSQCFLRLAENTNTAQLEDKFARNKNVIPIVHDGTPGTHHLKSLHATYFDTSRNQTIENHRSKNDLVIASVIALLIMAVALFNYMGLLVNRLLEKTREHTIRLVNGGSKKNLLTNFMIEIAGLVVLAFLLSLVIMIGSLPYFNNLTSSSIVPAYLLQLKSIALLTGIPAVILLASYIFAAVSIGKEVRIELLKSKSFATPARSFLPVYHIAQIAISIVLIVGSLVILKQISYITNKEIGLNKDVFEIKIPQQHKGICEVFKTELEKQTAVEIVSLAEASPVLEHYITLLHYNDKGTEKQYTPAVFAGDQNYIQALGIKIVDGVGFSGDGESNEKKCIINESLAKLFPGENLVGKTLPGYNDMTIIGVAKDFHYGSLKEYVAPGYITYTTSGFYILAKPASGQAAKAREVISVTWNKLITDFPLNMESIGDRYEWMHRENASYAKLIATCCFISVFLSMIGLFAVSYERSQRRIKEIGIRKVNGACNAEIMIMINSDFIKWIAIAFILACPIAWYAMHKWLENFAYKTALSWWVFATAGIVAMVIALLTVSWRAATTNPVESLRYE